MRITRFFVCLGLAAASLAAFGQAWEKPLAPGLTYRMEVDLATPRLIHALRFSLGAPARKRAGGLADGTVFSDNPTKGRETVTEMVTRTGALAGINGDFFPFTGDPLGVMVHDGQLVSIPGIPRAVFGWGPKDAAQGMAEFKGSL